MNVFSALRNMILRASWWRDTSKMVEPTSTSATSPLATSLASTEKLDLHLTMPSWTPAGKKFVMIEVDVEVMVDVTDVPEDWGQQVQAAQERAAEGLYYMRRLCAPGNIH